MIDFTLPIIALITGCGAIAGFLINFYFNSRKNEDKTVEIFDDVEILKTELQEVKSKMNTMEVEIQQIKLDAEKVDVKLTNLTDEIKGIGKSIARLETKIDLLIDKKII